MSIKKTLAILAMGIVMLVTANHTFAQQRTFSYQGLVRDAAKTSITGVHQLTVKLYDSPVEGRVLHSESFTTSFDNGIFNVIVGSTQPIAASVGFDKQYWLGVSIDDGAELLPRTAIVSSPTAIHAESASSLLAGATGAVRSMNGRSGDLILKGGEGTSVKTDGDNIIITAIPNIAANPQATTVNSIKGTANQVLANGNTGTNESGNVTLTLPQSIGTNSNVTFGKVTAALVGTNTGNNLGLDVDHGARIKGGTEIQNGMTISSGNFVDGGNMDVNGNAQIYGVTKLHLGPQTGRLMSSDVSSYGNGNGNTAPVGYGPIWNGTCIVADLCGNASTATNATNFTGSLAGDVTGTMSATYLSKIQGNNVLASGVHNPTNGQALTWNSTDNAWEPAMVSGGSVVTNSTLIPDGTPSNPLGINLANANTWTGIQIFPDGSITNNELASANYTVNAGDGLAGGGTDALGGTGVTLSIDANTDATMIGNGSTATPLGLNLNNENTWTATQTFPAGSITNDELASADYTVTAGDGLSGGGTAALGSTGVTLDINAQTDASLTGIGTAGSPLSVNMGNENTWTQDQHFPDNSIPNNTLENSSINLSYSVGLSGDASVSLGGTLNLSNDGVLSITGTPNQVIADQSTGDVTLSLPQDIDAGATPTFVDVNLTLPSGSTSDDIVTYDGGTLKTRTAASILEVLTASNGLTRTGNDFQLGGTLSHGTNIDQNGFDLTTSGTGNVGIGVAVPGSKLDVNGNIHASGTLSSGSTITINGAAMPRTINSDNNMDITTAVGHIKINPAGNVGIGTVGAPGQKLDVTGNVQFSGALMPGSNAGSNGQILRSNGAATPTWQNTIVGTGLSGDGITTTLDANIQHDATLAGIGTTANKLKIDLSNPNTWTGVQSFPAASIPNATLVNSSVTINTVSGLSGGGNVALGGTLNLNADIQHDATLSGIGTTGNKLVINLTNPNTWTGVQSFPAASIPNATLVNSSVTINTVSGLSGGGNVALGGTLNLNADIQHDATLSGIGTTGNELVINLTNPNTWTGVQSFPAASIPNATLLNSSLNVNTGTGLSGGGNVALGGTLTLDANIQHDASLSGIGTTGNPLIINTNNANNWTATQTFPAGSITIGELEPGATFTVTAGTGLSGGGTSILGGSVTLNNTGVLSITGTANQVIASSPSGNVTLSLPQDIDNTASPQFTNVNLTGMPNSSTYTDVVVSNGGLLQTRTITDILSNLTASNGLTRVGNDIQLGGTLSGNTDIASAGFNLNFTGSGKIGIGNNTPAEALDVTGNIHASGTLSSGSTIVIDGAAATRTITSDQAMSINTSAGNLTLNPAGVVQINGAGKFQFNEGSQASGWFLQCDASGVATWAPVSSAAGAAWTLGGNAFGAAPSTNLLGTTTNTDIKFITNGTGNTRMTIKGNGDVAITGRNFDIDGIHYAWPTAQAAANDYVLTNDGSGNLSWTNRIVNTTIFSYGEIAANVNGITIPNDKTVIRITGTVGANFNYTLPSGTNGQILFIYNNSNKTANQSGGVGNTNINNGTMIQFIYANGWIHVTG